ncbi:ABC transporter permease [Longimycelium tulufanense]|uniref:ABC transporter permease n=1 Tax=Longimycelium tulufanense TaxID=907463 RepID=A0A8J3FXE2_9PSEU|nr:hypothetical protein [Longimycelium tulufanense]GGM67334.1 ABC transporter permease [Longimycelium tulufanense]
MTLLAVERIKLFSTRSPWWCMLAALAVTCGFTALITGTSGDDYPVSVQTTQFASNFGLMVILVMAALAVTTEYRFGTIRATFQAVPNRTAVLLAKTGVVALLAGVVGEVVAFASWGIGKVMRPSADLALNSAADWRHVAGVGLVFAVGAVLAVAVGTLVRHTAGAVTLLLVWALLVETLLSALPTVGEKIQPWLPFNAASNFMLMGGTPPPGASVVSQPYGPWGALAYFTGVAAAGLVITIVVANRRDA